MVDTITVQFNFNYDVNQIVQSKIKEGIIPIKKKPYINGKSVFGIYVGSSRIFPSIYYNARFGYVLITINTRLLLGHEPTPSNITYIEKEVIAFFEKTFDISMNYIDALTLNRIDYKVDFKSKFGVESQIFYELRDILSDTLNGIEKNIEKNSVSYCPKKGYIELISYNKENELYEKMKHKKNDEIFANNESMKNYLGVIRTEVRVKNKKLNYTKKSLGLAKELQNYLDDYIANYFFESYAQKIWYKEPFYRIDIAMKKINMAENIKPMMKEKLKNLIFMIHNTGITNTKKFYNKKYTSSTFISHIKKIRDLGINPLTFSKKYDVEQIENFAVYKSNIVNDLHTIN